MTEQVMIQISLELANHIKSTLKDSLGNAVELLQIHDDSLGRTTKKNKLVAEMYDCEIHDLEFLIATLKGYTEDERK